MSKVVVAVNVMISNPKKISKVTESVHGPEIFFLYDGKHKWSMLAPRNDHYTLIYYPDSHSLEKLSELESDEWEHVRMVTYKTEELGTREALASFAELYSVIKEKLFGMDDVLDDIIESDLPF